MASVVAGELADVAEELVDLVGLSSRSLRYDGILKQTYGCLGAWFDLLVRHTVLTRRL